MFDKLYETLLLLGVVSMVWSVGALMAEHERAFRWGVRAVAICCAVALGVTVAKIWMT